MGRNLAAYTLPLIRMTGWKPTPRSIGNEMSSETIADASSKKPEIGRAQPSSKIPSEPLSTEPVWFFSVWFWFWAGLWVACLPFVAIYLTRMWRLPHYQYFPFAIGAVLWLAWTRSDRKFYPPDSLISLSAIVLGFIAVAGGLMVRSPWMVTIAAFFFTVACLGTMRGKEHASLLGLALPLALLIRLPLGYDQILVIELQRFTTVLSSLMLDVLGIAHAVSRNIIELPQRELFVAEACSGIQSVFTLAFLCTLLIAICNRRLWLVPFYLAIALILAVTGNVIRVTTVAAVDTWFGLDWADGWAHDLLGYLTLGLAALFLVSFDQLVISLLHPTSNISGPAKSNPLIQFWNWVVDDGTQVDLEAEYYRSTEIVPSDPSTGLFKRISVWLGQFESPRMVKLMVVLAIGAFSMTTVRAFSVAPMGTGELGRGMFVDGLLFAPGPGVVESFAKDFQLSDRVTSRDNENPILGRNSDTWEYKSRGRAAGQFVLSQTYASFHELCICYENQEWLLLNRELREPIADLESDKNAPIAYARFRTRSQGNAYLWYASITGSGGTPMPPQRPGVLASRLANTDEASTEPVMMVQLWMTSNDPLDLSITNRIANEFALLRSKIAAAVAVAQ